MKAWTAIIFAAALRIPVLECVFSFYPSTLKARRWSTTTPTAKVVSVSFMRRWCKSSEVKDASSTIDNWRRNDAALSQARVVLPQNVTLQIIHEDSDMLVINKPAGMVVQYASGSAESAAVFYLNTTITRYGSSSWPWKTSNSFEGIVHRLDKGTSGILVMAKNPQASRSLQTSFEKRQVDKTYLAIAVGLPKEENAILSTSSNEPFTISEHQSIDDKPAVVGGLLGGNVDEESLRLTPHQKHLSKQIKNCGRNVEQALELLYRGSSDPSASCFSAAISVCMRAGQRDTALDVFHSMSESGVTPNLLCFKTIINLCAKDPPLYQEAVGLVDYLEKCKLQLHPHCISAAISACGRAGKLQEALDLLLRMEQHSGLNYDNVNDVKVCLQAAIGACTRCGANQKAKELTDRLQQIDNKKAKTISSAVSSLADGISASDRVPVLHEKQLAFGKTKQNKGIMVNAPIGKKNGSSRLMGVVPTSLGGRNAVSIVTPLAFDGILSLNRVIIETGRTHQIRVHMANVLNCPLVGDRNYGSGSQTRSNRTMLHAEQIIVPHPSSGEQLRLNCPPPPDFDSLAQAIIEKNVL